MAGRGIRRGIRRGRGRGTSQNVPNDLLAQMVVALQQVNENLHNLNQNPAPSPSSHPLVPPGPAEYRGLDEFCRRNPSQFHGGFAPDATIEWIHGVERIFRAMNCMEAHKLSYATYMLVTEAENWWEFTRRQVEAEGQLISWGTFKEKFLHKYFPTDLKRKKEMEFLKLEEGNMSVGDYATKFEELARFCPYAKLEMDGRSKCVKFESGLKPKLKSIFGHQEIVDFPTLVNKCRVYEDDLAADEAATSKVIPPKHFGPQRNFSHEKGKGKAFQEERKPYSPPMDNRGYTSHGPRTHVNVGGSRLNSPSLCGKCGRTYAVL
ncbi:hypothetical protein Lal_00042100 [Lupinus albus]|nr:hypothetical protein Lal_00042100 [Lupinus albus]